MITGRYAPTPSGHMHLGNARTALLAWLQARQQGGRILLRIEDLDPERCRPEWSDAVRRDLAWLGLDWDAEAPAQSTRTDAYAAAVAELAQRGLVYECYCSRAEVRAASSAPHRAEARYAGTCRELGTAARAAARAAGRPAALRLRIEPGEVAFHDGVHGAYTEDVAATVGDIVIRRADGVHAYQLAVVVDDRDQRVSEVVRGDDLLSSTARQLVLQRLLRAPAPRYAHVPLLRTPSGVRLAKRERPASLAALRAAGSPTPALIGELAASLGLVPAGTAATPRELIGTLRLERLHEQCPVTHMAT